MQVALPEAFEPGWGWERWFAEGAGWTPRSTPADERPAFGGGCRATRGRPGKSTRTTNAGKDCCESASFRVIAGCWRCPVRAFPEC